MQQTSPLEPLNRHLDSHVLTPITLLKTLRHHNQCSENLQPARPAAPRSPQHLLAAQVSYTTPLAVTLHWWPLRKSVHSLPRSQPCRMWLLPPFLSCYRHPWQPYSSHAGSFAPPCVPCVGRSVHSHWFSFADSDHSALSYHLLPKTPWVTAGASQHNGLSPHAIQIYSS